MDLIEAEKLARSLMSEHGLIEMGWHFSFDQAKRRFGCCRYFEKQITLSSPLTQLRTIENVRNTILHEIAHALVGRGHNHDKVWLSKALEIGCNGKRCSNDVKLKGEWIAICEAGHHHYRHRKPRIRVSCGLCCKDFDEAHLLVYTKQRSVSDKSTN